jgi:predicted membrane chloride channel (bestrophin family)
MIEYGRELFGLRSLGRFHGSAVVKAQVPSLFSTIVLISSAYLFDIQIQENDAKRLIQHPYVIQLLTVFVTFILAFRANFAYGRVSTVLHISLCQFV